MSIAFWVILSFVLSVVCFILFGDLRQGKAEKEAYANEAVRVAMVNFVEEHAQELSRKAPREAPVPPPVEIEPFKVTTLGPIVPTVATPVPIRKLSSLDKVQPFDHGVYFFPYLGREFNEALREFKIKRPDEPVTFCSLLIFAGRPLGFLIQTCPAKPWR